MIQRGIASALGVVEQRLWREASLAELRAWACTTAPSVARGGSDPFRLPRIAPGQMDGEALARALS